MKHKVLIIVFILTLRGYHMNSQNVNSLYTELLISRIEQMLDDGRLEDNEHMILYVENMSRIDLGILRKFEHKTIKVVGNNDLRKILTKRSSLLLFRVFPAIVVEGKLKYSIVNYSVKIDENGSLSYARIGGGSYYYLYNCDSQKFDLNETVEWE